MRPGQHVHVVPGQSDVGQVAFGREPPERITGLSENLVTERRGCLTLQRIIARNTLKK